jgi:hypothetical protein
MNTKLFVSCVLAAGLPLAVNAQPQDAGNAAQTPTAAAQSDGAQYTQTQTYGPHGYLDPNFGASKPHAGTPLPADGNTPPPAADTQQDQSSDWYKSTPQAYDRNGKPLHLRAPKTKLQVYDDADPAPQQVAQEQEAPAPPYDDSTTSQYHVQPVPQYYSQPAPQAYAPQGQQNYGSPDGPQQNYANGQPQDYSQPQDDYGSAGQIAQQPLNAEQLEQLVAPIALYPDQLVAQILTASTYPAQITAADQWARQMNGASPEQIAEGASAQTAWDPSIKALTAFPQVLQMLDSNLQWTAALGNAYYNQPQDVMQTIQVLRQRAEQAGNLQSTPQEQVVQEPNYIQIQPASPEVVYVPSYNPWYAYGAPIAPYPTFEFGNWGLYIGSGIEYGLAFTLDAFLRFPFGLAAWGCDWLGGGILFNHDSYWTHSREVRDWGFEHGGRRWDGGRGWGGRGGYGGRDMARFGNYQHQGIQAHPGGGFNRSPLGRGFGGPQQPLGGRNQQGFGHIQGGGPMRPQSPGQQAFGHMPQAYGRPQQFGGRTQPYGGQTFGARPQPYNGRPQQFGGRTQAYGGQPLAGRPQPYGSRPQSFSGPQAYAGRPQNFGARPQPYAGRPQQFAQAPRAGNGFGGYSRPGQGFSGRPAPLSTYRAPQSSYGQRSFGGGSNGWGQSFARPQQHGGGSFFGGGHSAPSFGGGGHAFGGGSHSFGGGGHSMFGGGGHSSGGGHSFGGGGHSFGGGGHSFGGGGHSGGGHSDGGHSGGGGHHR